MSSGTSTRSVPTSSRREVLGTEPQRVRTVHRPRRAGEVLHRHQRLCHLTGPQRRRHPVPAFRRKEAIASWSRRDRPRTDHRTSARRRGITQRNRTSPARDQLPGRTTNACPADRSGGGRPDAQEHEPPRNAVQAPERTPRAARYPTAGDQPARIATWPAGQAGAQVARNDKRRLITPRGQSRPPTRSDSPMKASPASATGVGSCRPPTAARTLHATGPSAGPLAASCKEKPVSKEEQAVVAWHEPWPAAVQPDVSHGLRAR
jgi:hypothetical protein